ncbi:199_t:CDS:2 [Ambispora leptoticha]|uniref:199_t:CDS:1 n=1 Tax=Ambispora leptoticha TaxID=144679 RepID=A0A9N9C9L7_9GLOM|nr:199_t:CDS:2 [Ambispora leptoticha]
MRFHFFCLFFWVFAVFAKQPDSNSSFCFNKFKVKTSGYRKNAKLAQWAYTYEKSRPNQVIQVRAANINDVNYEADHVFEAQIVISYFRSSRPDVQARMCSTIEEYNLWSGLQDIMNSRINMRFLDKNINKAKGIIFGGKKGTNKNFRLAAVDYLKYDDVRNAFAQTRALLKDNVARSMNTKAAIAKPNPGPNFLLLNSPPSKFLHFGYR